MKKRQAKAADPAELRQHAESRLKASKLPMVPARSAQDNERLVHELQVHQIELEMQNEELCQSRAEVETGLARYTDLYDFAPMGYLTLDRDGAIREANLAGASLLGAQRATLIGRRLTLFVVEADQPVFNAFLQKVFATGARELCEVTLLNEQNPPLQVRIEATPASDGQGCRAGVVDITDHKRTEEALRAAKAAAETAIKVKDEFLAKLSHELRTPLTPILLAASRWQTQAEIPAAIRDDLAMVCRNLELEARLLDDLLDVNRILYGKLALCREVVTVHQAIIDVLAIVAATVQAKQLKLTVHLQAANDRVEGDPTRVRQILWNLLSNAIKFTPDAGSIDVSTVNEADGEIRVQITDSGMGMEPAMLSQLFNPFEQGGQQVNRQYGGMGLGMTICKAMVKAHGGSITATSDGKNKGTTFTVRLPLTHAADAADPTALPLMRATLAARARVRILLVEDHADTARIMSRLLCAEGHAVETAGDIASALDCMKRGRFDLLLSDMGLPDGSGLDLMGRLVASGQEIKAIALSGYGMEEDLSSSREAGFAEHLVKPVQLPQLLAAIERVIGSRVESSERVKHDKP